MSKKEWGRARTPGPRHLNSVSIAQLAERLARRVLSDPETVIALEQAAVEGTADASANSEWLELRQTTQQTHWAAAAPETPDLEGAPESRPAAGPSSTE